MNAVAAAESCPYCHRADTCACVATAGPSRALRNALGAFATGVAVVTTVDADGRPYGLTINSFASVSLEPPLVLWSLARTANDFAVYVEASHFCIHVLGAEQAWLSNRFATPGVDRFAGLEWVSGSGGVPILPGMAAWFEVRNSIRHPGGDHLIFVGEVERFHADAGVAPLLFHGGRYGGLQPLD